MFENIRKLRRSHNMTQSQLADLVGTTQQNINSYEHHRSTPGYDIILTMADHFNVTADYIIRGYREETLSEDSASSYKSDYSEEQYDRHMDMFRKLDANQKELIDRLIAEMNRL